jgi:hypothetical protein
MWKLILNNIVIASSDERFYLVPIQERFQGSEIKFEPIIEQVELPPPEEGLQTL